MFSIFSKSLLFDIFYRGLASKKSAKSNFFFTILSNPVYKFSDSYIGIYVHGANSIKELVYLPKPSWEMTDILVPKNILPCDAS